MCGLGSKGTSSEKDYGVADADGQGRKLKHKGVHIRMVSNKRSCLNYPRLGIHFIPFQDISSVPIFPIQINTAAPFLAFHGQQRRCGQALALEKSEAPADTLHRSGSTFV